jgi:5-methylcytosine-specific restriction endonuclease McrA
MQQTLILNSSFEPINIVCWQRAMQLFFQGKVEVVEVSEREIRTISTSFKLPSVMRLLRYIPLKKRRNIVRFSRSNILLRDRQTCQYCGRKRPGQELTLDHVMPAARGGRRTWDNIVTACLPCNQRKGGRTPFEASMKLISEPVHPKWLPSDSLNNKLHTAPEAWRVYLSWEIVAAP